MQVKNRKYIRKLSVKMLSASKKRNIITVIAIALTTLMFTSLFTVIMSINATYQNYQFKLVGGYSHGAFKDVTQEQIEAISKHPGIKATGERTVIGIIKEGAFAMNPGEVSFMDKNKATWSYAVPTSGRMPERGNEVAMDTKALELLGIDPVLNSEIQLTYTITDKNQTNHETQITDTFILVGFWECDSLMAAHYINISREYKEQVVADAIRNGMDNFRTDLDVMLRSSINIEKQLEQIDTDLGYQWDGYEGDNIVRIGVNWGYTTTQLSNSFDFGTCMAIISFLVLVVFTGYLIIYNIFQISVAEDIRFYGLIKTIGVTPKQLKRIIRHQALLLCIVGVPLGLMVGYGVGAVLTPLAIQNTSFGLKHMTISTSPVIFLFSTLFAIITVLLSCAKPGKRAGKVSPIEATRYTEVINTKKKERQSRGAKVYQMAFANLGRNRKKTVLVVISLSLSVVLLNILVSFVSGFDVDTYLSQMTCADFIVSGTGYFTSDFSSEYISQEKIAEIQSNTESVLSGCGYTNHGVSRCWMKEDAWMTDARHFMSETDMQRIMEKKDTKQGFVEEQIMIEGLDQDLLSKLSLIKGDLTPLINGESNYIAIEVSVDDDGKICNPDYYPAIGESLSLTYCDIEYIDSRTGKLADEDTPFAYYEEKKINQREVNYTVCAYIDIPYSMSYRYSTLGYITVLPVEVLAGDSEQEIVPMFYLLDTPDERTETEAENYLAELTESNFGDLKYESKATRREEFADLQGMFLSMGGVLCATIGLVGILNFFNAIMTGIISRRKELAVLQAVGMTNSQLKQMLIYEGLLYTLGSALISLLLSIILQPLAGVLLEKMFWFYKSHFVIFPVVIMIPVFAFMGWLIPTILNKQIRKQSVVERLRISE